jgi:hypothetical protein
MGIEGDQGRGDTERSEQDLRGRDLVGFFVDVEMGKHKSCRAPAHTAIRYILLGLDPTALEVCVANALRICAAEGHRDMFCDSHFRSPGIEMAPGDTTVGSRPA